MSEISETAEWSEYHHDRLAAENERLRADITEMAEALREASDWIAQRPAGVHPTATPWYGKARAILDRLPKPAE